MVLGGTAVKWFKNTDWFYKVIFKTWGINLQVPIVKNKICLKKYINNVSLASESITKRQYSVLGHSGSTVKRSWMQFWLPYFLRRY